MLVTSGLRNRSELFDRVRLLSRRLYIQHPVAENVVSEIEFLTNFEQDEREGRLIVAKSGNGKTYIAKRILRMFPPRNDPEADAAEIPVLRVLMPGKATRHGFAQQVLRALGQTRKPSSSTEDLLGSMFALIPALGVKTLLLDDFQHLNAGSYSEKEALRNEIKKLGEQCNVTMIALGTETALNVINTDDQLLGRFEAIPLPVWTVNDDLRNIVYHLEQHMGLTKPSNLADNDPFLKELVIQSEGTIGAIVKIFRRSAIAAMLNGAEKIDRNTLKQIDWIRPSLRVTNAKQIMGIPVATHGRRQSAVADPTQAKAA